MLKIRISSLGKDVPLEVPIKDGEFILDAVKSAANRDLGAPVEEVFQVLVNGKKIPHEVWGAIRLRKEDNVLVAPVLKGGDSGSFLRTALILAATIAANVYAPGLGFAAGTVGSGVFVAAVTIGATLLANALIPPPTISGLDLGSGGLEGSQMYSISGQSNQVKKFSSVPKVYGTHRVFPTVAASPYTELETDQTTGEFVQYLYAIYDLGLGPMQVSDIRIGDTLLQDFAFKDYKIVDFNRPVTDEGEWDAGVLNKLTYYKGDNNVESVSVQLNNNEESGGPTDLYQATRNSAVNAESKPQEIILTFVNPRGLSSISATGATARRNIDLRVEFAPVGTNDWKGYSDSTVVSDYEALGGDINQYNYPKLIPPTGDTSTPYTLLSRVYKGSQGFRGGPSGYSSISTEATYGIPKGATSITFEKDVTYTLPAVNDRLYISGKFVGEFLAITADTLTTRTYSFKAPIPENVNIQIKNEERRQTSVGGTPGAVTWVYTTVWTIPNVSINSPFFGVTGTEVKTLTPSGGRFTISANSQEPLYSTLKFTPIAPGQYKVRVTRVRSYSTYTYTNIDDLAWTSLNTRLDADPIITDKRHCFLELKIRATNQLSGAIQNLSAVCTSALMVNDGTTWSRQLTSNPAWVFADLLTGEVNKRAIPLANLDLNSLLEWADFCDEIPSGGTQAVYNFERFQCNFLLDYQATLQTVLSQICGAAQAGLSIIDGKYGVLIDRLRTTPVQIFTSINSRNFSSSRSYSRRPDAVEIQWVNPANSWDTDSFVVYEDGFDVDTAEEIDQLVSFGCTNPEQAFRFGRYMMAQNKLRQENMSIEVDFENLVCTRGDYVQIVQDSMLVGGVPGRVTNVTGNQITFAAKIETEGGVDYGYVFRGSDGVIHQGTLTVMDDDTFELDDDIPEVGDLFVFGEVDFIVYDCLVKAITPGSDLTAVLSLVEKADAIYQSETPGTIPDYEARLSRSTDSNTSPPPAVEDLIIVENNYRCDGAGYEFFIDLDWELPEGAAFSAFEIYVDTGRGLSMVGTTQNTLYRYIVDQANLGREHTFKVLAVSASGKKIELGTAPSAAATPERKSTPPSNIERLSSDITNEVLQLTWEQIPDCDVSDYLIRYSPVVNGGSWESSVPLVRAGRDTSSAAVQARTGTYFVKAIDYSGNESTTPAIAITTIPNLFNLNVIEEVSDFPTLPGATDRASKVGDTLILDKAIVGGVQTSEFYEEGYYYSENLLDLGDIFTARLQATIEAEGYTEEDLMVNWDPLSDALLLANSKYSEWDVEFQYRSTEDFLTISDWVDMASIDPISEGLQDEWTEWRTFIMGDATGRIFQFRLKLISRKPSVTPRILDATVRVDMPDRTDLFNNLVAPDTGYSVVYDPPFKGPGTTPNVQVTLEDGESGDYWEFTAKSLTGFTIQFFDNTDTPVARTFDAVARGYGRRSGQVI